MRLKPVGRHWIEVILSTASILIGVVVALGQIGLAETDMHTGRPQWAPSPAIADLPMWQGVMIAVAMLAGGTMWLLSYIRWYDDLANLWLVQRIGAGLVAIAWTSYALAGLLYHPESAVSWIMALSVAAVAWGSPIDSKRSEARTRSAIERMNR